MERCATCKHWQPLGEEPLRGTVTFKGRRHIWWKPNSGVCGRAGLASYKNSSNYLQPDDLSDESRMFVQDGSDYFAALITKADFGCVEHAPKA